MSQFEFLTVAFSVLLAVTVTRLAEGMIVELRSEKRYWVHLLWILQSLFSAAGIWWALWGFENVEWSYLIFLLVLGGPTLLFTQAVALVPRNIDDIDWQALYYHNARFFMLVSAVSSFYMLELAVFVDFVPTSVQLALGALGIGYIAMAFVSNPKAHKIFVLACLFLAATVIAPSLGRM